MTDSLSFSPRLVSRSLDHSNLRAAVLRPLPSSPTGSTLPRIPAEDRFSQGMLLGLVVATVPAVVYALLQTWSLASNDGLLQAVRAFVP